MARLPDNGIAVFIGHPFVGSILFWCHKILRPRKIKAIIDHDIWLKLADEFHEFFRLPVVMALSVLPRIAEIEPDDIDFAIVRQQLRHLVANVFGVTLHVAAFVELLRFRAVAHGMDAIQREVRMMPVDKRIVETDMESFRAERVHDFTQQVFANRRVGGLVVRPFAVPQAEALMVFRRDDEIRHAGRLGGLGPFLRVEHIRIEQVEIFLVLIVGHLLEIADPFMARRHGIKPPDNEHAEAVMRKPACIAFAVFAHINLQ